MFQVAIAGTQDIQPRTHQIESGAIRSHIQQANPQVGVAAIAGEKMCAWMGPVTSVSCSEAAESKVRTSRVFQLPIVVAPGGT